MQIKRRNLNKENIKKKKQPLFLKIKISMHILISFVRKNRLLSAIFCVGLFLRLLGTNPGYPQIHSDEPSIQEATRILVVLHKYDPQNYYYGSLLSIIYAFFIIIVGIPIFFLLVLIKDWHVVAERGIFGFLDYFFNIVAHGSTYFDTFYNFFPYWTRYETAILSSFASIVVYYLVKRLFNRGTALIAAFLTAVNYRHVLSSTLTLADGPAAVFSTLSVFLSIRLLQNQTRRNYLIAGFGLGCALSVKYFIYILPAFFLCHFLAYVQQKKLPLKTKLKNIILNKNLFLALLLAGAMFVIINPYLFLNHEEASRQMQVNAARYGLELETVLAKFKPPFDHLISVNTPYPFWYLYRFGYGEILTIAAVFGFFYCCFRYKKQSLIIGSVVVPFLFLFAAVSGNTPVRNYAVITPLLLIFPSVLLYDIVQKIKHPRTRNIALVFLVVFVGFSSLKNSWLSSYFASLPLNYTNSFTWMNKHLKENAVIAKTPGVFIQKNHTGIPFLGDYTGAGGSPAELKIKKAEYVIIASPNTTLSNMLEWIARTSDDYTYYDQQKQWELINNTYVTLLLRDLTRYTIARFYKPYWQSLEPSLIIIKFPLFWGVKKDILVHAFPFDTQKDVMSFTKKGVVTGNKESEAMQTSLLKDNTGSSVLRVSAFSCTSPLLLSSKKFVVYPGEWYTLSGKGQWKNIETLQTGSGFLRLDYYSKDNSLITTSVSQLLLKPNIWTTLTSASFAPKKAAYAIFSLQIDRCSPDNTYLLDDMELYRSHFGRENLGSYPYSEEKLPKSFIWLPEIL